MSSTKHYQRYVANLLLGLLACILGVITIAYASHSDKLDGSDWLAWAAASALLISCSLFLFMQASVHKVKYELKRSQRIKGEHKTETLH